MRGQNSHDLPDWWIAQCREWVTKQALSMTAAGERIAKAVKRPDGAYGHSTISRYLAGGKTSPDVTYAFAAARGVEPPIIMAGAPEDIEWSLLGQELRELAPHVFRVMLAQLESLVIAERSRSR